ncbi:tRNA(Met) cytidine acetyltransferase TmcA [Tatumella citrea]|uniref:tRNA(Met) cytidine acetyltransferase TmcA n=1 Tax=Tatumella citrea TaxID=53336 RepID=A0A1Y0LLU2_TATCI|nr:GNAT family N-acetyltransferase [Tatumella citrea]ARU94859.1 hypothetical protein A7K98_14515 [Tatumella citrea]ARU98897.1 hypothetical protein A7K99_14500 [Tatumella citrea]
MTNWQSGSELMRRAGVRRICVICGSDDWVITAASDIRQSMSGDWLTVSPDPQAPSPCLLPSAVKGLLGREFMHAIFDARQGFHAEALACLAGTLLPGSWLLLLLPPVEQWGRRLCQDSLRWADTSQAIAAPYFMQHLKTVLGSDSDISYWHQHQLPDIRPLAVTACWHSSAGEQQSVILQQLQALPGGVAVVTAPRGRGKSALAGMLAKSRPGTLITAPAKTSVDVLRQYAGETFCFVAPDALLADPPSDGDWLIVDEAAAIPAPVLRQMISHFRHVLLVTTVQGYEGTGRGFLLKFCASLPEVQFFSLSEPLRWAADDPLERMINRLFLFDEEIVPLSENHREIHRLPQDCWQTSVEKARAVYQLLSSAHYRTTPLDLRRMMDAPGMHFWLAETATEIHGALWLLEEGGLSRLLSEAVWAGFRRPKGNLVAQSLAAHGGFPEAAMMRSLRISRVAVHPQVRRQGIGRALVSTVISDAGSDCDYLSVSFGLTDELWQFWYSCGFRLVRIGNQREASSGCYTAMAVLPLSDRAMHFTRQAEHRLQRNLASGASSWLAELPSGVCQSTEPDMDPLNEADWQELAGFAWGNRPFETSYPVLMRLRALSSHPPTLLEACDGAEVQNQSIVAAGGRKAWLQQLRQQIARQLTNLDPQQSVQWQQKLEQLRKI